MRSAAFTSSQRLCQYVKLDQLLAVWGLANSHLKRKAVAGSFQSGASFEAIAGKVVGH